MYSVLTNSNSLNINILNINERSYSSPSPLLIYNRGKLHTQLESSEGVRQGDPFSAFGFALGVQSLYENAIKNCPHTYAISIQDDLTLIGPSQQVFQAYDYIYQHAKDYHLHLSVDKCAVYMPISKLNNDNNIIHRNNIQLECANRTLQLNTSLETLGVMIGPNNIVRQQCDNIIESHSKIFAALHHPNMPVQIALALLRSCALPRLSYLARTVPPALFRDAAKKWDQLIQENFLKLANLDPNIFLKNSKVG